MNTLRPKTLPPELPLPKAPLPMVPLPMVPQATNSRSAAACLLGLLLLLAVGAPVGAAEPADPLAPPASAVRTRPRWSAQAIELADSLPVQAGGRIKPLITYAGYTLLALTGRKSIAIVEGGEERSLGPTEWMLDVLFFPDIAARYRVFLVTDDAALDAVGFTPELRERTAQADYEREGAGHATRKKRDRWSFADLEPAFAGLAEQVETIEATPPRERSRLQQQVRTLSENLSLYWELSTSLRLATARLALEEGSAPARVLGGVQEAPFSAVAARLGEFSAGLTGAGSWRELGPREVARLPAEQQPTARLLLELAQLAGGARGPALLPPPPGSGQDTWQNPSGVLAAAEAQGERVAPATLKLLEGFERFGGALGKPTEALAALRLLHDDLVRAAEARGEYRKVPLEVTYQRLDPVQWSRVLSMLGLAFALLGLLSLRGWIGRVLKLLSWVTLASAAGMLVTGIVLRCVIRDRPPVTTLYETVLFITATGMLAAFVMEVLSRRWIALPVAGVIGTLGLLLAQWFEGLNKQDTMPTLEAVLDTNFWLSTHVTTVSFGYSAGLLAALLGQIYVLGRVLGIGKNSHEVYAAIGRAVYGVVCFGLLLSLLGTILGGIWANDSWGRFWGWDPKENGALMIVIWELIVLHARLGGYVGPFGFSMLAVVGGAVVSWSWWGVNQLGVGLHSYGFTEGIQTMLNWIYAWLGGVLLLGLVWSLLKRRGRAGVA